MAAAALLLAMQPRLALAQGGEVIEGTVVNSTAGGGPVGGSTVTLQVFDGVAEGEPLTTTDDEGAFRFEGLDIGQDMVYALRVDYADQSYTSGWLAFQERQTTLTVPFNDI